MNLQKKIKIHDIYFIYGIKKLIEQFVNKLEFVRKINKQSSNKLSSSVISSHIRNKLNESSLNLQYSA
jgi:hypothetical protein